MTTLELLSTVNLFNGDPESMKDRSEASLMWQIFNLIKTSISERKPVPVEVKDAISNMTSAHKSAVKTALDISVTGTKVSSAFTSMTAEEIASVKTALGIS